MFQRKPIRELWSILKYLKSKLAELDKSAIRLKERDYLLTSPSELNRILRSQIPTQEKKNIILRQIGLARINLFSEYHERILKFEKNKQFDEALKIMNDYIETIAFPFLAPIKKQSFVKRFMNWILGKKPIDPTQNIRQWRNEYHSWFKEKDTKIIPTLSEFIRKAKFDQIKTNFYLLYNFSFSKDNFPSQQPIITYDPTYVIDQ